MNTERLFDISGKVAVVTGGGDGIGKASCLTLASAGASVVVSDLISAKAQAVADIINAGGGKAAATACNVLDSADLKAMINFAVNNVSSMKIK